MRGKTLGGGEADYIVRGFTECLLGIVQIAGLLYEAIGRQGT
jgi:hypothetical protein